MKQTPAKGFSIQFTASPAKQNMSQSRLTIQRSRVSHCAVSPTPRRHANWNCCTVFLNSHCSRLHVNSEFGPGCMYRTARVAFLTRLRTLLENRGSSDSFCSTFCGVPKSVEHPSKFCMFDELPATIPRRNPRRTKALMTSASIQIALITAMIIAQMAMPEKLGELQLLTTLYMAPPPLPPPAPAAVAPQPAHR